MVRLLVNWLYRRIVEATAEKLMADVQDATGQANLEAPVLTFDETPRLESDKPKRSRKK